MYMAKQTKPKTPKAPKREPVPVACENTKFSQNRRRVIYSDGSIKMMTESTIPTDIKEIDRPTFHTVQREIIEEQAKLLSIPKL